MSLFSTKNNYLGIDIGSSSIKMVELGRKNGKIELITYGYSENSKDLAIDNWMKDTDNIVKVINNIYKKMEATTEKAVATLPAFAVFSSIINLRDVDKKGLAAAVEWEAKKLIPLPLEEMILDWQTISVEKDGDRSNIKVFLTGSPKKLVKRYVDIFRKTDVVLTSLETETFSLVRALLGEDKSTVMIIEIGFVNTVISIIKEGVPILSRSLDLGGKPITKIIADNLNVGLYRAEQFKRDMGVAVSDSNGGVIPKTIMGSINAIVDEAQYLLGLFQNKNNEKVEKIILSGGSALLPNLVGYFSQKLNMNVIIGDPWARVSYAPELKTILNEIGPGFSVAIGSAMKDI
jgi:type IV pilus assembly protein PilM